MQVRRSTTAVRVVGTLHFSSGRRRGRCAICSASTSVVAWRHGCGFRKIGLKAGRVSPVCALNGQSVAVDATRREIDGAKGELKDWLQVTSVMTV
jgi:LSD1 subclass zinc finger protein